MQPELLRIDFYVFVLHAIMTAMFVALPFVLQNDIEMPLSAHWKIYLAALAASLLGTVPLILSDEREGKAWVFSVAIAFLIMGFTGLLVFRARPNSSRLVGEAKSRVRIPAVSPSSDVSWI